MKRSVFRLHDAWFPRRSAAVGVLSLVLVGSAVADAPGPINTLAGGKQSKQLRMRGKKAVMHVYYYVPKTLEITSVISRFFKNVDDCESAVGVALRIATSHAGDGELVDAQCVAIDPPEGTSQPQEAPRAAEVTQL